MNRREMIVLFVFALFCAWSMNTTPTPPAAPVVKLGPTSDEIREQAEMRQHYASEAVKRMLIDPDSAQFRNVINGLENAVCGTVNSRNRFGGYHGFRHFIYVEGRGTTFEGAPGFRDDYVRYCFDGLAPRKHQTFSLPSFGISSAHAAPVATVSKRDDFRARVEHWARVYMPFPVTRVTIGRPDALSISEVMIEMHIGETPLVISVMMSHYITDEAMKDSMIRGSMMAVNAVVGN